MGRVVFDPSGKTVLTLIEGSGRLDVLVTGINGLTPESLNIWTGTFADSRAAYGTVLDDWIESKLFVHTIESRL